MNLLFLLCGIVTVGFVLCISVYLIFSGVPAIAKIGFRNFFFGQVWQPTATTTEPSFGILPFLLTSIYGTAGAILMGIPIGLLTAVSLPRWPRPGWQGGSEPPCSFWQESRPWCTVWWA